MAQCAEQANGIGDVGVVIPQRVIDGLGDDDARSAVNDRFDVAVVGHDTTDEVAVSDRTAIEDAAGDMRPPPGGQVVENHRGMPRIQTGRRDRRPDVPGAAGDEDLHSASTDAKSRC